MDTGDQTLRFYNYVLRHIKQIAGVYPLGVNLMKSSEAITYLCISEEKYEKQNAQLNIKGPTLAEVKNMQKLQPRRILLPKAWTSANETKIRNLYNDKTVKFIVFPVLCIKKRYMCNATPVDKKKHTVLFAYNKVSGQLEYWDDLFISVQKVFGNRRLVRQTKLLKAYFINILRDKFGFKFTSLETAIPKYPENSYIHIKRELEKANHECNHREAYKIFIADYIRRRVKRPGVDYALIAGAPDVAKYAEYQSQYKEFNFQWKQKHACSHPMKILNTETGNCIKISSKNGRKMLGIREDCPYPKVINVATNACKQIDFVDEIDINKHYIEGKKFLNSHVAWKHWSKTINYFLKKFPYMAMSVNCNFKWEMQTRAAAASGGANPWKLTAPKAFDKTMAAGLTNPDIRFIVFFIVLAEDNFANYHSNILIIDKTAGTVERFEPTEPVAWASFNNGAPLDKAVSDAFAKYELKYIPMMDTCPIGFQGFEVDEDSLGFKDFGGNCQVWTLWYMDLRLSNPTIPRNVLVKSAWKQLEKEGSLRSFINSYHNFLSKAVKQK